MIKLCRFGQTKPELILVQCRMSVTKRNKIRFEFRTVKLRHIIEMSCICIMI